MHPDDLLRVFDQFEERMRGCDTWPYRVGLEPFFKPLLALERTRRTPLDDSRKPRLVDRFRARPEAPEPVNAPVLETPEPRPDELQDIAEFTILAPKDFALKGEVASRLLSSLRSSGGRLSFEIVGSKDTISIRLACAERNKREVVGAMRGYFPDVKLREEPCALSEAWQSSGEYCAALHLALQERVFRTLRTVERFDIDPLIEIVNRLDDLEETELGLVQIVFEPARPSWGEELVSFAGSIEDVDKVLPLIESKFSDPVFAVFIRAAGAADDPDRCQSIAFGLASALHASTSSENALTIVGGSQHEMDSEFQDILDRETRRTGMILSLSELATLVHIPSASVRSGRLRRQSGRTKAAPNLVIGNSIVLGTNEHDGEIRLPSLSQEMRLRHTYVIGASGTGKSTLLLSMAAQDIAQGNGFAVLDPHGDLVEDIIGRIPEERAKDVILFDPADEGYPVGFNILSAHSELERTLLASDLVSVFKRLSTTFGDVMVSVLGNAVLAFLESTEGGTLIDLRNFLVDESFRSSVLKTINDAEVVSYWKREFPLLKGMPHAPVLTRLNTFLRPKLVRRMVAQKNDRLDFRRILDSKTIFLAKLSQGAIGEENSYLLGSLLVSRMAQAAMSRQNIQGRDREPYILYIDEFHHFVTPSVASILSGARKYGLGLVLAHQESRQLRSRSEEVASAVLGNAATRVVFRVGEQDARALAEGFSFFEAKDLQSLGIGEAVARIERADFDFNLRTDRLDAVDDDTAAVRRAAVVAASRGACATAAEQVDAVLAVSAEATPVASERPTPGRGRSQRAGEELAQPTTLPGRGGAQHKYLQSLLGRLGEDRGFDVRLEETVLDGHGYIDVVLEGHGTRIGCEISVSTKVEHEVGNLTKCLAAGFNYAVLVSSDERTLDLVRAEMSGADPKRVRIISPGMVGAFLDELVGSSSKPASKPARPKARVDNAAPTDGKGLMTTGDAAAYIGLAVQTLAEMRVTGESPPFHKLGRRVFYDRRDLDDWLSRRRRRSTSDQGRG